MAPSNGTSSGTVIFEIRAQPQWGVLMLVAETMKEIATSGVVSEDLEMEITHHCLLAKCPLLNLMKVFAFDRVAQT